MHPKLVLDDTQRIALHDAFIDALRSIHVGPSSNPLPLCFEKSECAVLGQILTSSSSTRACADFLKAAGQFTTAEWVKGVKKPTTGVKKEEKAYTNASNNCSTWLKKNNIYTDDDVEFSYRGDDAADDGDAASGDADTDAASVDPRAANGVKTKKAFSKLPVNVVRYFLATAQQRLKEKPDDGVARTLSTLREIDADVSLCSYIHSSRFSVDDYNALKEYFNRDFVPAPTGAKDGSTVSIFSIQDDAYIKKLTADLLRGPYDGPPVKFSFGPEPRIRCYCGVPIHYFPIGVIEGNSVMYFYHPSCFNKLEREVREKCKPDHYKHPDASNYGDLSQQLQDLVDYIFEFEYDQHIHFGFDVVPAEEMLANINELIAFHAKKRPDANIKRAAIMSSDDDDEGGESDSDAGGGGKKPVPSRRGRDDDDDGSTGPKRGAGKKPPPKRKGKAAAAAQSSSDDDPSSDSASEDDAVVVKPRGKKATAKRARDKK